MPVKRHMVLLQQAVALDPAGVGEVVVVRRFGHLRVVWVIVQQLPDPSKPLGRGSVSGQNLLHIGTRKVTESNNAWKTPERQWNRETQREREKYSQKKTCSNCEVSQKYKRAFLVYFKSLKCWLAIKFSTSFQQLQ